MSKSSKNSFLMQGMILAAASIVCRVIGLLYRSPLFGIIGKEGMGYYSYAYNIYNIILLIASFSIPLAVSKSISARLAKKEYINAQRIFYGALVYAVVVGGIASMIVILHKFHGSKSPWMFHHVLSGRPGNRFPQAVVRVYWNGLQIGYGIHHFS